METQNHSFVDEMEHDAKYQIITLEDENEETSSTKRILQEINDEITRLYSEFKEWMNDNTDSEHMNPRIAKLKADTEKLIEKAKAKLNALREDEKLCAKLNHGKDIVVMNTVKAVDYVSEGVKEVMNQETVKKVVDNVNETYHQIKNDERVKQGVKNFKKGTLILAESAFEGLKKILDDDTTDEGNQ